MRAELAAVVSGADGYHSFPAGGIDAGFHGGGDRWRIDPVDHDLEHRVHAFRERADLVTARSVGQ